MKGLKKPECEKAKLNTKLSQVKFSKNRQNVTSRLLGLFSLGEIIADFAVFPEIRDIFLGPKSMRNSFDHVLVLLTYKTSYIYQTKSLNLPVNTHIAAMRTRSHKISNMNTLSPGPQWGDWGKQQCTW